MPTTFLRRSANYFAGMLRPKIARKADLAEN
jgi:hypothetical protein